MNSNEREFKVPRVSDGLGKPKRVVALVSDTHVGSDFAVFPDGIVNYETNKNISAMRSDAQIQLLKSFNEFVDVCGKWKVDTIVHCGDAIQGVNPKEAGRNVLDNDIQVQEDAFVKLMTPLVKGRIYHQLSGTRYHESLDVRIHKDLVDKLKPVCKEAFFHHSIANIHLKGTNKTMNVAHAATSAPLYRSMVLDREGMFILMAEAQGKLPHIDYIIRGHLHYYMHLDFGTHHVIQVPAWQSWFPYKDTVRLYGRMQPDIGGVLLFIDEKDRTSVHHYLYSSPAIVDFVKEG